MMDNSSIAVAKPVKTRSSEPSVQFKKALGMDMLPEERPLREQLEQARAAGFSAIEMESVTGSAAADQALDAADRAGVAIHSVTCVANWRHPLSSPNAAEVAKGIRATVNAIENAHRWGADSVLLIPAVVNAGTSYQEAYERSQRIISTELLPVAQGLGIVLGVENVWNGFLLSPLEYVRYIDELSSEWVRAYLDLGNMIFGHPEHWVRTAGARIAKLHVKDFRFDPYRCRFSFAQVGSGDVDWAAVRTALLEVGFSGYATSTGIPRNRVARWMSRAARSAPATAHALSFFRHRQDSGFLSEVSRRFDDFRAGVHIS